MVPCKNCWKIVFCLLIFVCVPLRVSAGDLQKVRIAVKEFPPLVLPDMKGLCIDMAREICKRHDLIPEFVLYKNVPEFLQAVESGTCQLGFAGITITAEREKTVDFSQPFFDSGLQIAIHAGQPHRLTGITMAILRVVGVSLTVLLLGLTLVAHLIWWLERDDSSRHAFSRQYRKGIIDAYWWAIVTMTTVGYGDKYPRKITGRLVAALWMIIGVMWFAAFTATLSSTLTLDRLHLGTINSLADLDGHTVAVIKGTTTEEYLRYYSVQIILADSLSNMVSLLKKDQVDAIIYDSPPLLYTAKNDVEIQVVGDIFAEQRYGVVFPENSGEDLKEIFDQEIITMRQNGEYKRIYNKWL
jgi:ABC-type amino acid transport substrate-binding protein